MTVFATTTIMLLLWQFQLPDVTTAFVVPQTTVRQQQQPRSPSFVFWSSSSLRSLRLFSTLNPSSNNKNNNSNDIKNNSNSNSNGNSGKTEVVFIPSSPLNSDSIVGATRTEQTETTESAVGRTNNNKTNLLPITQTTAIWLSMVLAFTSGIINCACLSGLLGNGIKQCTAGVTGAWTNDAIGAASSGTGHVFQFLFQSELLAAYFGGSMLTSIITPQPQLHTVPLRPTILTLLISSTLLLTAFRLAKNANVHYLIVCCFVNGITNSFTSTLTHNLCRSSHFTGTTSDMGTFVGQWLRGNTTNLARLKTISGMAGAFWMGSFVAYKSLQRCGIGNSIFVGCAVLHVGIAGTILQLFKNHHPQK